MSQTTLPGSDIKPWIRPAPQGYKFINANIVDVETGTIKANTTLITTEGKITYIGSESSIPASPISLKTVDCQGKYLCPGLFDAHVHLCAVPGYSDLSKAFGNPNDVHLLRQPYTASQMLHRGFTSIRDCGGAQLALKEAIEDGVFPGPRVFIAGHALSQFGGHGDLRGPHEATECCGGTHDNNHLGRMCNGVPECIAAVREEIRRGADFIKIMGSGGVASPTDKLEHLQFTVAEIQAMVECADNAGTFVTAHAYTVKAIRHCIDNGVRGIEHGNFVDAPTAKLMAEKGVYLTPTLIAYAQMASERWKNYLPIESQTKNSIVLKSGLEALRVASEAGVTMCYGSDLLGPLGSAQTHEFALRSQVLSALEILRSATVNPAKMMGCADELGQIKEGFHADVVILNKNPLDDVTVFDKPDAHVLGVMKDGRVYKSRWDALLEDGQIPVRVQ
ncbi:hypothetical protein DTO013E5_5950 [Penicillium roqueforti]|uniref:Imidazolonepropionase n=1 Tax=Penicillium roqueforti (strain FM164) TaxID=1365484 RepID=W6PZY9_PENRF|nr:hypothetical protein CBS147337_3131 [Penicillium roqueforti]CDM29256.1 Imidazolonepropionase [Penicillium roqueforti FM164]KAI2678370.1 hypothetical protein LCP963914a_7801 [Penicillium roqueforti]KAI2683004.1 hypothetical protein CBS147355_2144 [Penicillium roqueforti]KAI2701572.1 hypothetical protein CBS147372_4625 [Penicillium roqueforti]